VAGAGAELGAAALVDGAVASVVEEVLVLVEGGCAVVVVVPENAAAMAEGDHRVRARGGTTHVRRRTATMATGASRMTRIW
jgi:hypothetical protein